MTYTYIHKGLKRRSMTIDYELAADNYKIGTTVEDYNAGKWLLLTAEQIAFLSQHAYASVAEILACRMTELPQPSAEELLAEAKMRKIAEIDEADKASEVFCVGGVAMWLDKATRLGLLNESIPRARANGATTITLWSQGDSPQSFVLPVDTAEALLGQLTDYAIAMYNITASHKAAVSALTTVEAVEAYEVGGYPEHLNFD